MKKRFSVSFVFFLLLFFYSYCLLASGNYSHEISVDYLSEDETSGVNQNENDGWNSSLNYLYAFKPVKFQATPINENLFLQRVPFIYVGHLGLSSESRTNGVVDSESDGYSNYLGYNYANINSPFTVLAGVADGDFSSESATSTSDSSYDSRVVMVGYYVAATSKIDVSIGQGDYESSSSSGGSDSSKFKSSGINFRHYQQLSGQKAMVLDIGYDHYKETDNAGGGEYKSNTRSIDLIWYFSAKTGITFSYARTGSSNTRTVNTGVNISHYVVNNVELYAAYAESRYNSSFPGFSERKEKEVNIGLSVKF